MKTLAAIALILIASSVAHTQWKKDGKPVEDTLDRKSVGTLGAQLLVVRDPRAFIKIGRNQKRLRSILCL